MSHINVGCGDDIAIGELAKLIASLTDFKGAIAFDITKPDGTPHKLMDVSRLKALGWQAKIDLRQSIVNKPIAGILPPAKVRKRSRFCLLA